MFVAMSTIAASAGWIQPSWVPGSTDASPLVVLVGGLKGPDAAGPAIEKAVRSYEALPLKQRRFSLYGIPVANPEASQLAFPPAGTAYRQNGQSHFIWRWLGLRAPDLVVVIGDEDYGLTAALPGSLVAAVGKIPAVRAPGDAADILSLVPKQIAKSEAHIELDRRRARTPRQLAEELASFYGHDFDPPVYIPAMALIGRVRLGQQADVATVVAPYIDGRKDGLAKATSSHLAGHLIFAELAERTGDKRYVDRVRAAADLAFTETGEMREAMPLHNEMSDAVFMGCPILASAGKLTGKSSYFDMAVRHLHFMQKLCLRPDGLYRHSPLNEAAWGRGNAFPALGVSWTLLNLPTSHAGHAAMVRDFQEHMRTLAKFQDRDGMWHEVIDEPGSYAEFSATAMIATAMLRGVKHGWLDGSYQDRVQAAWRGILARVGPEGALVDVCESRGKQKSLEDYLNRAASFGKDARGGGMAMLLATELMGQ
jgi:rhamnogalacturonyl hydrolase YesR